jgi:hypothetical protein
MGARFRSDIAKEKAMNGKPEKAKSRKQVKVKGKTPLQRYANVYIKHKATLFPLMEEAMGEPVPKDANHGEMVALYIDLLKNNPEFAEKIAQMTGTGEGDYEGAVDPVSAIAEGAGDIIGGVFGFFTSRQEGKNIEAHQEAMLYQSILEGQKDNDTKTILVITGLSLVAVAGIIYVISKSRK